MRNVVNPASFESRAWSSFDGIFLVAEEQRSIGKIHKIQ